MARWFGAEITASRPGPTWMTARGWHEVDWTIRRETWLQRRDKQGRRRAAQSPSA